jgi:hypothetical protein
MPDGTAVASQAPPSGLSGVDMGSSKYVFYRGEDNALWYKSGSNVVSLGGQIQGDPDATFFNGGIAVVARGANNSIWQRQYQGGSWGPWKDLGGITIQSPTIVSWGGTRLDVFIAGGDSQLWHRWSDDGQNWSGWQGMGGILTAAPDAASWGFNRIDLGVRGGDGALWHMYWANGWSAWESLGGQLLGGPGVTAPAVNRVDFAVRGTNNGVFLMSWNGAQWVGWSWLDGGMTIADPDLSAASGRTTVYVRGSNSLFYADTRQTPGSAFGGWIVP